MRMNPVFTINALCLVITYKDNENQPQHSHRIHESSINPVQKVVVWGVWWKFHWEDFFLWKIHTSYFIWKIDPYFLLHMKERNYLQLPSKLCQQELGGCH